MDLGAAPRWGNNGNALSLFPLFLQLGLRISAGVEERMLSTATRFLADYTLVEVLDEPQALLVTAWHVLAGLDSVTGEALDKDGWAPSFLRISYASDDEAHPLAQTEYPLTDQDDVRL